MGPVGAGGRRLGASRGVHDTRVRPRVVVSVGSRRTRRTPLPTLLAVDGNSLAHRAWHAAADDEREGAWMVGLVVRILAGVWFHGPYHGVLVGFDHPVNHRKLADPGYKAGRAEKDPQLREHLARLPERLAACGFTIEQHEGAEADDVLATVADHTDRTDGLRAHLLSSDKDLLALVSSDVTLLRPRGSMTDLVVTDPARVRADHGVEPSQYVDLAAMRGDPSDGLRGVHGIGRRTAARLLRDHGSVEELYAHLHHLDPKVEAKLRAGRDEVDRNLALMTPLAGVPADVDGALERGVDLDRIDDALTDLGQGRAAGMLRAAVNRPAPPPMPPTPEEPDMAPPTAVRTRPIEAVGAGTQDALF